MATSDDNKYSNMLSDGGAERGEGGSNFTGNQFNNPSILEESGCCDTGSSSAQLGVVGVFCFIAFVLGCVATSTSNDNADRLDKVESTQRKIKAGQPNSCEKGDVLFGATVFEVTNVGSHNWYAILGNHGASMTWRQAYHDAKEMCFHGHAGFLSNIGSASENLFIQGLIQSMPDYASGDDAWIGGIDAIDEGEFLWIGPGRLDEGEAFYSSTSNAAINNAYINWADNEPNAGGESGLSEDCVAIYGGGGKWYDSNCYSGKPFFIVEFGIPGSTEDLWYDETGAETLDDHEFTQSDDDDSNEVVKA